MNYETLIYETSQTETIATITLNRPKAFNAFTQKMRAELLDAVQQVEASDTVKVAIIRGAGPGFCAGADLSEPAPEPISDQIDNEYKPVIEAIHHGNKIYIAQVHKNASGAGAGLAMACDLLVMDDKSTLYMAFAAIELIPDCGSTWQLLHAMGRRHALEAIIQGKHISAADCVHYGLANQVVPRDELESCVQALAESIAARSLPTLSSAKRLLHTNPFESLSNTISIEAQEQNPLILDEGFKKAVAKFFSPA